MDHILTQLAQFRVTNIERIQFVTQWHPQMGTKILIKVYQQFIPLLIVCNFLQCNRRQGRYLLNIVHDIVHEHWHFNPKCACFLIHLDQILEGVVVHVFKTCRGARDEWFQVGDVMWFFIHMIVNKRCWEFFQHCLINFFILKFRLNVHFVIDWYMVKIVI